MNTKVKQLTLLATAGFLLAACGQGKKEETTTVATTQAPTTQATTQAPTTQAPTTTVATTTVAKENAVQAPEGQEAAVFKATIVGDVLEYIVYHKGDTITKVVIKAHRSFEKFGKSKDTLLKQEKIFTEEDVKERKEKYSSVDGVSISYEVNGYTVTTIEEYDYTKVDFAKLKEIDPKKTHSSSFSEMKSEFERQKLFKQVQ